ncbi:hypothetical protein [Alicyclobacillus acidoterrestris]|nr:hypothetical protein [Alicyclobacillus acidoterrestris]EPZ47406.1 hypothetical protein N007_06235 [Alicyclobacillus acidoterrestris ATCC 49025]
MNEDETFPFTIEQTVQRVSAREIKFESLADVAEAEPQPTEE